MMRDGIRIHGYPGAWYVVEQDTFHRPNGEEIPVYLLESEMYGDEAAWLVVDDDLNVVLEEVWNGVDDLREYEKMLEWDVNLNA